jgi:CRP/FNR family transcriptional regulator, cyclic AMP receptor protein
MREDELKAVPLFASLSKKELRELAKHTDEVQVPAGKRLANQGELAYEFFVITEGSAEVTQGDRKIREIGTGDFFGEIGLLESERRTATVTATSPMSLIVMTGRDLRDADRTLPELAEKLRQALKERLEADST